MATHTNTLNSHHGEHRTYPADKPCPVEVVQGCAAARRLGLKRSSAQRGIVKRYHARKSRRFHAKNCQVYKADPSAIE